MVRRLALAFVAVAVALVGLTWFALEASDVARVTTQRADGSERETHVWWVELGGEPWLEAGTPENGWFVDVGTNPELGLTIGGETTRYRAVAVPSRSGDVREALRRKYGWRDRWVGLFVDASRSLAVRLDPIQTSR